MHLTTHCPTTKKAGAVACWKCNEVSLDSDVGDNPGAECSGHDSLPTRPVGSGSPIVSRWPRLSDTRPSAALRNDTYAVAGRFTVSIRHDIEAFVESVVHEAPPTINSVGREGVRVSTLRG